MKKLAFIRTHSRLHIEQHKQYLNLSIQHKGHDEKFTLLPEEVDELHTYLTHLILERHDTQERS